MLFGHRVGQRFSYYSPGMPSSEHEVLGSWSSRRISRETHVTHGGHFNYSRVGNIYTAEGVWFVKSCTEAESKERMPDWPSACER